jgi:hypothetical protein
MKTNINEIIQWTGALFIVVGHTLNAIGPSLHPWNIIAFFLGTIAFFAWALRMKNNPQMAVNLVSGVLGVSGLVNALM